MAYCEEVIIVDVCKGKGIEKDPCRRVTEVWSKDGKLIATCDPYMPCYDSVKGVWIYDDTIKIVKL